MIEAVAAWAVKMYYNMLHMRQNLDWRKWSWAKKFTWKNTMHKHFGHSFSVCKRFLSQTHSIQTEWLSWASGLSQRRVHNMNNKAFSKKGTQLPMMLINFFSLSFRINCVCPMNLHTSNTLAYTLSILVRFLHCCRSTLCPFQQITFMLLTRRHTYKHTRLHARTHACSHKHIKEFIYKHTHKHSHSHIHWMEKGNSQRAQKCLHAAAHLASRTKRKIFVNK